MGFLRGGGNFKTAPVAVLFRKGSRDRLFHVGDRFHRTNEVLMFSASRTADTQLIDRLADLVTQLLESLPEAPSIEMAMALEMVAEDIRIQLSRQTMTDQKK